MTIAVLVIGFLGSAVLSVLVIHAGASLAVRVFGRDECLSPEAVNGCNWWPLSTFVSTLTVMAVSSRWEYSALIFVPVGPILCLVLVALSLRFGELNARSKEFTIDDMRVVQSKTGGEIHPAYVETGGGYCQTGPASGYCLYSITVHDEDGSRYTNGYVSKTESDRVSATLTQKCGCSAMSLVVESRESVTHVRLVVFGQEWTPLLCGRLAGMSEEMKKWWRQWLQPGFGLLGAKTEPAHVVRSAVVELERCCAEAIRAHERMRSDCGTVKRLLDTAEGEIWLCTLEAHSQHLETRRGTRMMGYRVDEGVWDAQVQ